jgi:N-carbamoyl-L-amino-acid hydrolase
MVAANPDRVLKDLYELREIGRYKTGVHRPTLSPDDMEARRWLAEKLHEIGHDVTIDGIANVLGKSPGAGPHVLAGSHIESQNHAGWLDGALGVVYALEAARAVAENPSLAGRGAGVDVLAFADEEGHFGPFLGSYSFVGELSEDAIDSARDRTHGKPLRDCLADVGLAGKPRLLVEPERYSGFFEAHIEQGNRLETEGLSIGIVTSIVAIWQYRIVFTGAQNHAGTTTMAMRKDAGKALMQLWHRVEEAFPDIAGPHSVWTIGRVSLDPGGHSIIPGGAELLFQFRDAEQDTLDRMHTCLERLVHEANAAGPCSVRLEILGQSKPAIMAEGLQDALVKAAKQFAPSKYLIMPSGAGHDAQVIAPHIPSGMMFVPSIGGISHHWTENTSDEDLKLGALVFTDAIGTLLNAAPGQAHETAKLS